MSFVLDVQFLYFNGAVQSNNVSLNWSVIMSQALDRFEIERSTDNANFTTVITMVRDIPLGIEQSFSANDDITNVHSDVLYYRLKIIADNGAVKYSNVLLIRRAAVNTSVSIQPNPASDNASVHFYSAKENETTIRLIDNLGKIVMIRKEKVYKGNNSIQLNDLYKFSNGVYSLQITVNGELTIKKLIIRNR